MNDSKNQKITNNESIEIDTLKASYWTAVAASAHNTFSEPSTFQLSLNDTQKPVTSKSRFDNTQTSQWLMASKPKASEKKSHVHPPQPEALVDQAQIAPKTDLPDIYRVTLNANKAEKTLYQAKAANDPLNTFFEQFESAKNTNVAAKWQTDSRQSTQNGLDCDDQLNILTSDFSDNELSVVKNHWTSKLLNNPKMVASVIGICLLASSVYAGIGYWWLTSSNVSQAAEPESGQTGSQSSNTDLFNIKALQMQSPTKKPNTRQNPDERLIAQAEPVATFATMDSSAGIPELSGRPDPFSPLIEETNGAFIAPAENQDALTGVQYTGFIGGANSKDKIAIIKVFDPNPAIGPKTLFKKAGESFYINGERIYLTGVGKSNLSLQLKGENRALSLNPYKVIVNNAANNSGTLGSTTGSNAVSGDTTNSNFTSSSASGSSMSGTSQGNSYTGQPTGNANSNNPTSGNTINNSGNGINVTLEE